MRVGSPRLVIQHHPTRVELLNRLVASLTRDGEQLRISVAVDNDLNGLPSAWRSYRAALALHPDEHTLIVQDDTIAARGAAAALPALVEEFPDQLVCLCVCGMPVRTAGRVRRAHAAGETRTTLHRDDWVPTVATMWPPGLRADFLAWAEKRFPPDFLGDDSIVGKWREHHWTEVAVTVPSLFQHPDDAPSLIKRRHRSGGNKFRTAVVFDPDWTAPITT